MGTAETTTLQKIHQVAVQEFLEKGFQGASLRKIVKEASVTTGAFYGYYKSKEELFEALVGEPYNTLMNSYRAAHTAFVQLPPERQPENMGQISEGCMHEMLLYAYQNLDAFHLLLCCAEGTRFAGMIDEMVDLEIEATHAYQVVLAQLGRPSPALDERLEHVLVTGMFNAYFELILHEMPLERAERYLTVLHEFYTAGWLKIMGQ